MFPNERTQKWQEKLRERRLYGVVSAFGTPKSAGQNTNVKGLDTNPKWQEKHRKSKNKIRGQQRNPLNPRRFHIPSGYLT